MKKETITIQERLPKPYEGQEVFPFQIGEGIAVPVFGDASVQALREFATLAHELLQKEPLVVFWGLSGGLGCYYSTIKDKELTSDMLNVKITVAKTTQPFSIYREKSFELTAKNLGGIQSLKEIPFEEAMLVIEGKKEPPAPEYEEPEEAEFDDDCLATCQPGDHKCGK